ncbi:MAG TPA: outer membrane lipid asymmetry maintenance protein MlaD [Gammaproteobacteria bacterium]|nr:outer membrane lipid asymmetry maintenance protein MlaD [Gammaproteobacteria bacterium]
MKKINVELVVGIFMILGFAGFAYIAIKLGDVDLFGKQNNYPVSASFNSVSGLKEGAFVEIAGVRIGKVSSIRLDPDEYEAVVTLTIDNAVKLQEDSIASIRTAGIMGDRFVNITPGGAEEYIEPGGEIEETESAISLEELISKYIFKDE